MPAQEGLDDDRDIIVPLPLPPCWRRWQRRMKKNFRKGVWEQHDDGSDRDDDRVRRRQRSCEMRSDRNNTDNERRRQPYARRRRSFDGSVLGGVLETNRSRSCRRTTIVSSSWATLQMLLLLLCGRLCCSGGLKPPGLLEEDRIGTCLLYVRVLCVFFYSFSLFLADTDLRLRND